jgi:hypothetical protein
MNIRITLIFMSEIDLQPCQYLHYKSDFGWNQARANFSFR